MTEQVYAMIQAKILSLQVIMRNQESVTRRFRGRKRSDGG